MSANLKSYDEFDLNCPEEIYSRKAPDRRWRQVLWHLKSQTTREAQLLIRDPFVRQALQAVESGRNRNPNQPRLRHDKLNILTAIEHGQSASHLSDLMKAFLLAGQTHSAIAKLTGLRDGTIDWFERLFFEVTKQLDACDWIEAFILVPADRAIDDFAPGSPEYEQARDRAVLFDAAYRGGMKILMRIVPPAEKLSARTNPTLLNDSPTARILKWLQTSDASPMDYVQLLDRVSTLLANEESLSDHELDNRLEVVAKYIEHGESKRSGQKKYSSHNVDSTESVGVETTDDRSTGSIPEECVVTELPDSICSKSAVA